MYRLAGVIAVVALAALIPPTAAGVPHGCGPRSAQTVKQTRLVRVFLVRERDGTRSYRACMRAGSRGVRLGDVPSGFAAPGTHEALGRLTIRGRFVTYVWSSCAGADCWFELSLTDVKRRRDVWKTAPERGTVGTIVATDRGQAAFVGIARNGRERYVAKLDSYGVSERDRGPDVTGLALRGGRIAWRNGSTRRSEQIAHVRRCGPPTGSVAIGRSARVFSVPVDRQAEEYDLHACLFSGGPPMYLTATSPGPSRAYSIHTDFRVLRGHVVWLAVSCLDSDCSARMLSADLRQRTLRAGERHAQGELLANNRGHGVLVTREFGYPRTRAIYALDSAGDRELDFGAGIDPESVRIEATTVTWTRDGEARSAELR